MYDRAALKAELAALIAVYKADSPTAKADNRAIVRKTRELEKMSRGD